MSEQTNPHQSTTDEKKLSFTRTLLSVLQGSFGVQSQKNKERDFGNGSAKGFIAAALIFTTVFVLTLLVIVAIALP